MSDLNRFYADSCDHCLTPAIPGLGVATADGLVATYSCCGTTWACDWALVPGRALPPQPRVTAA